MSQDLWLRPAPHSQEVYSGRLKVGGQTGIYSRILYPKNRNNDKLMLSNKTDLRKVLFSEDKVEFMEVGDFCTWNLKATLLKTQRPVSMQTPKCLLKKEI